MKCLLFPKHLPNRKAGGKGPVISLCHGSLNPEFRALLSYSKWLVMVRKHGTAAPSVVGTQHPPQSSVLHVLKNLREMYSGVSVDFIIFPISACLPGEKIYSLLRDSFFPPECGRVGTSIKEALYLRGFDLGTIPPSPPLSMQPGLSSGKCLQTQLLGQFVNLSGLPFTCFSD